MQDLNINFINIFPMCFLSVFVLLLLCFLSLEINQDISSWLRQSVAVFSQESHSCILLDKPHFCPTARSQELPWRNWEHSASHPLSHFQATTLVTTLCQGARQSLLADSFFLIREMSYEVHLPKLIVSKLGKSKLTTERVCKYLLLFFSLFS